MQHVSSLGGPRVLLPTEQIDLWIDTMDLTPNPDEGIYKIACSINNYCGVIAPWMTPLLIFGDDPTNIYYNPDYKDGLLFRWCGADSLDQLNSFAIQQANLNTWDEITEFTVVNSDMTLMDTCTKYDDLAPRIKIILNCGNYLIKSRYIDSEDVITIIHLFEHI